MSLGPIDDLVSALKVLPGIGNKSAGRLAYFLLESDVSISKNIEKSLMNLHSKLDKCPVCGFYKEINFQCDYCNNPKRDSHILCVIARPQDLLAIEATHSFIGGYHILGGTISPLDGISPSDLRINELLTRINSSELNEIILALDSTVDGETTAQYISSIIDKKIKITRIAAGIPFGGELEYTDKVTISRALSLRREL